MSTLSELSSKADYIANRSNQLKAQWQSYRNSLTQAINAQNKKINHELICGDGDDIRFLLFKHFIISIRLSDDFFSHDIIYRLNIASSDEPARFSPFAHAQLSEEGTVDTIPVSNKPAILEHYLAKIAVIYQCLFDALRSNQPISAQLTTLLKLA
ncbi:MAG: formate hydrogenlyase regulator HycA [Pantoea sp.]|nr:formate hydrogenlyase regulator HycA [Pantoea sp.]